MKHPTYESIQIIENLIEKKEHYHAEIEANQFIKKFPEHPFGYLTKASLIMKREYKDEDITDKPMKLLWKAIYLCYQRPEFQRYLGISYNELGIYYRKIEDFDICISLYHQSLEHLCPSEYRRQSLIHFNLATSYLVLGQLYRGFQEYKWVYIDRDTLYRYFSQPYWQGERYPDKTLLIHNEQAYGDLIFFMRLIRYIKPFFKTIMLEVTPRLVRLVQSSQLLLQNPDDPHSLPDPQFKIVPRPEDGKPHPPEVQFDFHTNYALLPYYAGITMETIPNQLPYLRAEPPRVEIWKKYFTKYANKFKIGINWAGKPTNSKEHLRKIPLSTFMTLAEIPNVQLFALQKFVGRDQIKPNYPLVDLDEILDQDTDHAFLDTAAAMTQLDLVITSDTSTAHVAGCLNRPVWILLHKGSEWRWFLDREDSPWYPEVCRLFRQTKLGDWESVMEKIRQALTDKLMTNPVTTTANNNQTKQKSESTPSLQLEAHMTQQSASLMATPSKIKKNLTKHVEASPFVAIQNPPWSGPWIDPNLIVDPELLDQYKKMHYMGAYDGLGRYIEETTEIIQKTGSKTFLDYGSGKGKQYYEEQVHLKNNWKVEIWLYDPAVPGIDRLPDRHFDFIYCTEVMEHLPEHLVEPTIDYLFGHADKAILVTVSLCKAMKKLPNGENSHTCIKPQSWWESRFKKYEEKYQTQQKGLVIQYHYTQPYFTGESIIPRELPST